MGERENGRSIPLSSNAFQKRRCCFLDFILPAISNTTSGRDRRVAANLCVPSRGHDVNSAFGLFSVLGFGDFFF